MLADGPSYCPRISISDVKSAVRTGNLTTGKFKWVAEFTKKSPSFTLVSVSGKVSKVTSASESFLEISELIKLFEHGITLKGLDGAIEEDDIFPMCRYYFYAKGDSPVGEIVLREPELVKSAAK